MLGSGDPQYAHYGGPLHVKVETIAPAHIAYQRIAGVLESLSTTLQPVSATLRIGSVGFEFMLNQLFSLAFDAKRSWFFVRGQFFLLFIPTPPHFFGFFFTFLIFLCSSFWALSFVLLYPLCPGFTSVA